MENLQYFLGVVTSYGNVNTLSLSRENLICVSDVPGAGLFRMDQSLCEGMDRVRCFCNVLSVRERLKVGDPSVDLA